MDEDTGPALVLRIDDEGIVLRRPTPEQLQLELQGRRVWSLVGDRDSRRHGQDGWLVPWPKALRPRLNGSAPIVVRSSSTGDVLFEDVVVLGDGRGTLSLVDAHGNPLTVDKANRVQRMFADAGSQSKDALLDAVTDALELLRDNGHRAFLAFGCLLGAVRDGRLIDHDSDADVVYVARPTHPVDVMRESMSIEREFLAAGWRTRRLSGADFKLLAELPDGQTIGIDVFTAFFLADTLYVMPAVAARLPESALLPTSTVTLEGRELPAPADPSALLEATYGPSWRTPDPAFKYKPPSAVRRRLSGYMRGERRHQRYWEEFYATEGEKIPDHPSDFARWVADRERRGSAVVDIGCGNGRDSLWFAEQGLAVVGMDYARSALRGAARQAAARGLEVQFRRMNLYDLRHVLTAGALLPREGDVDAVYARFLVHALEDEGRTNLWRLSRSLLRSTEGRLYLEFRTEATTHEFGEHYRNFVEPRAVIAELVAAGFTIEDHEDGHGLAVHHEEDPRICRIAATCGRPAGATTR